jgi:cytochrome c
MKKGRCTMYVYPRTFKIMLLGLSLLTQGLNAEERVGKYKLAETISSEAIQSWNISVFPDGKNLPEGKGDHTQGQVIYDRLCMACHGENGKGGIQLDPYRGAIEALVKGKEDSLISESPKKNIGTYWQYAPLVFDYIRRTMPYQAPKSLSNDEVYALTAYLLAENGIISKKTVLGKNNLPKIKMPNIDGFLCDNSIDTKSVQCMENCPLPHEEGYNQWVKVDHKDYLKSDCLVLPVIQFGEE